MEEDLICHYSLYLLWAFLFNRIPSRGGGRCYMVGLTLGFMHLHMGKAIRHPRPFGQYPLNVGLLWSFTFDAEGRFCHWVGIPSNRLTHLVFILQSLVWLRNRYHCLILIRKSNSNSQWRFLSHFKNDNRLPFQYPNHNTENDRSKNLKQPRSSVFVSIEIKSTLKAFFFLFAV